VNEKERNERILKREKRKAYREKLMGFEHERRLREWVKKAGKKFANETALKILTDDKKKSREPQKRGGADVFLALYSYIRETPYDRRNSIPLTWRPKSFNKHKQRLEFLRKFVYPYPLPETLLRASLESELSLTRIPILTYEGIKRPKSEFYGAIKLAKKWVNDIASGESFYKLNKRFFTKAEAHCFLSSKVSYVNAGSVLSLYFYAKCKARSLSSRISLIIADVFSRKFLNCYKNPLVESFLDLLARTPEYRYEKPMLEDLCDFVLPKIHERGNGNFSFSGRTVLSVIRLTNEWHKRLKDEKVIASSKWKGLGITQFRYEDDKGVWKITELRTAKALYDEGAAMRNCVSSYSDRCASGSISIFTLDCASRETKESEKMATLEVRIPERTLVQAKGKCNSLITPRIRKVITRWASLNRITLKL
jgi:hypothetical protein